MSAVRFHEVGRTRRAIETRRFRTIASMLCGEKLEDTAQIYAVGGGYVSRVAALTYGPSTTYQMCRLAETAPPTPPTARS
jgi:hypothetical protein